MVDGSRVRVLGRLLWSEPVAPSLTCPRMLQRYTCAAIVRAGGATMSIARSVLIGCGVPAFALYIASAPAMAETRGYAISFVHMAEYAEQGNCPNGGNGATTEIHIKALMDAGKTRDEALKTIVGHDREIDFDHRGHLFGQTVTIGDFPTSVPDDHIET